MEIDISDLAHFDSIGTERETIEFLIAMLLYFQPAVIVEAGTYKGHFAVPAARPWGCARHARKRQNRRFRAVRRSEIRAFFSLFQNCLEI